MSDTATTIASGCLAMRARLLSRVVAKIYDDALRPHGLKATQLNLLVGIALSGPVRQGALADWFELDKSSMSRNVARLAEQGWVRIDEEDGRSRALTLTKAGQALLEEVRPAWEQAQTRAAARVGKPIVDGLRHVGSNPLEI